MLGGCGPHVYGTPASVQKLLLAATVLPKLNAKQTITVTDGDLAIEPGSSAVGLVKGGRYSIATLWLGLILNSGNDAANTLARLGGGAGGLAATVASMNAEARRLGAFQTHAVTPSGLDGPGQFTSAYDLALIARVCFDRTDFLSYAQTKAAKMPAQKALKKGGFQFQNENKLIYNYPGALGGKTGFTQLARHSYVGAAERGRPPPGRHPARRRGPPAARMAAGRRAARLGFLAARRTPRSASWSSRTARTGRAPPPTRAPQPRRLRPRPTGRRPTAARDAPPGALSLGAAAAVAVVLAATPLLLLLTQRRRRTRRRRPAQRSRAADLGRPAGRRPRPRRCARAAANSTSMARPTAPRALFVDGHA